MVSSLGARKMTVAIMSASRMTPPLNTRPLGAVPSGSVTRLLIQFGSRLGSLSFILHLGSGETDAALDELGIGLSRGFFAPPLGALLADLEVSVLQHSINDVESIGREIVGDQRWLARRGFHTAPALPRHESGRR